MQDTTVLCRPGNVTARMVMFRSVGCIFGLLLLMVVQGAAESPRTILAGAGLDPDRVQVLRKKRQQGRTVTEEEQDYLRRAWTVMTGARRSDSGAGRNTKPSVAEAIAVPESRSPVRVLAVETEDGQTADATYRLPEGDAAVPVVLFIHGGLNHMPEAPRRTAVLGNPVVTRFLARGYAVAYATFRTYRDEPQSQGPILDILAIVDAVKKLPRVDAQRVVVYGGSGGGSLALEVATRREVSAVIVGEPATIIYAGMLKSADRETRQKTMTNPAAYLTPELRAHTLRKLSRIAAPILIFHGDVHDLRIMNLEIFLPLLREAGVYYELKMYAGQKHGFYFGKQVSPGILEEVVDDAERFARRYIASESATP